MTGDKEKFENLTLQKGGQVTFGDNSKGKILGISTVSMTSNLLIENVLLVDGLKHNLLSISQLCDKDYEVVFDKNICSINSCDGKTLIVGHRHENVYTLDCSSAHDARLKCLTAMSENSWLWHRRLGQVHMDLLSKLSRKDLVVGLPKIRFAKDKLCSCCQLGKHQKNSLSCKNVVSSKRYLELVHMDLIGPNRTVILGSRTYCLIIVDDYSRYTWVIFLKSKNDAFAEFARLMRKIQNQKEVVIKYICTDNGTEFKNSPIKEYCDKLGIDHNFSAPRTPKQNGVVERKNRTLEEMARMMLSE